MMNAADPETRKVSKNSCLIYLMCWPLRAGQVVVSICSYILPLGKL